MIRDLLSAFLHDKIKVSFDDKFRLALSSCVLVFPFSGFYGIGKICESP